MNNVDLLTILTDAETDDRLTAVDGDGYIYDVETGEVLDRQNVSSEGVHSDADADAALKIRAEIEADLKAHDLKAQALTANLAAQRAAIERRLKWWEYRFGFDLVAYARSVLKGKARTAQFAWGKVSFRRTPERRIIMDMPRAVAWMRERDPSRVKVVESVALGDVVEVTNGVTPAWLVRHPEGETVRIETGV